MANIGKREIRIRDWPFDNGEKVKLIWIGEPFKENNKWLLNAYFKGNYLTQKIKLDWASVHFLSVDKFYSDGNLNNGEPDPAAKSIQLNFNGIRADYNEKDWIIHGSSFTDTMKSRTFSFRKNGKLYVVPIIEVIRTILAPDKFLLNRIIEMDTLDHYFTYTTYEGKLAINFTSAYEEKLLKNEKINHLAWMITNPDVLKMFNKVGANLFLKGELKFDFLFDTFDINALTEDKGSYIRILQIQSLNRKKIKVNEINIFHPSLEDSSETDGSKFWKYVSTSESNDRVLDSEADGSTEDSEEISTFLISHTYESLPAINRMRKNRGLKRTKEDENTKLYLIKDDERRTTADSGGESVLRGLEFRTIADLDGMEGQGELNEFIEILKIIEKAETVNSVNIIISDLPDGKKGKGFSKLSDGVTNRKYAAGVVALVGGQELLLLDVEREDRALSILLLYSASKVDWIKVIQRVLIRLIKNQGSWDSEDLEKLERYMVVSDRIKHKRVGSVYEKSTYFFNKIVRWGT